MQLENWAHVAGAHRASKDVVNGLNAVVAVSLETCPRTSEDHFSNSLRTTRLRSHPNAPRERHCRSGQYRRRSSFWEGRVRKNVRGRSRNRPQQWSTRARILVL